MSQVIDGQERPIAFGSRTLSKAERNYCVTRKELLAVVNFTTHYKHYLYGMKFTVRTDHSSLRWLLNFKEPQGQMARWLQILSSYDMDIQHRPGVKHGNADALSRIKCKQCGFKDDWEESNTDETIMVIQEDRPTIFTNMTTDLNISLTELKRRMKM